MIETNERRRRIVAPSVSALEAQIHLFVKSYSASRPP